MYGQYYPSRPRKSGNDTDEKRAIWFVQCIVQLQKYAESLKEIKTFAFSDSIGQEYSKVVAKFGENVIHNVVLYQKLTDEKNIIKTNEKVSEVDSEMVS